MYSSSSVSSEDNEKIPMWTLIHKKSDDEYDCVPNEWLISANECYYPPDGESVAQQKKYAKQGILPNIEWPIKEIRIIKRDFENFDRCVMDACRLQNHKRTLTSSENEVHKKRPQKVNLKYKQDFETSLKKESLKAKHTLKKTNEFAKMPSLESSKENENVTETFRTPSPVLKTRRLSCNPSVESASKTLAQRKSGCHLRPNLKHTCIFERGEISMDNLAMQLCSISRSIYTLTEEVKHLNADMSSRWPDNENSTTKIQKDESSDSGSDVETDEISKKFPFMTLEDLMAFNESLKDFENQKKTARVFKNMISSYGSKSYPRATTALLRGVIGQELTASFTWKGHARKGHTLKKLPFGELAISKLIVHVVKKRYGLKSEKVKKTIAAWLSQTQSKKSRENTLDAGYMD